MILKKIIITNSVLRLAHSATNRSLAYVSSRPHPHPLVFTRASLPIYMNPISGQRNDPDRSVSPPCVQRLVEPVGFGTRKLACSVCDSPVPLGSSPPGVCHV